MSNRRYKGNTCRLIVMMILVFIYFVVELTVGHVTSSISLQADSFHMLSDLVALGVGMAAIRISKWPRSPKNTFGWQRAEVLGTLVNTVMLVTLCFTILLEAIERMVKPENVEDPQLMVGVGAGGLLINIIGLVVLWNQGHGHGHSHDAPSHVPILLATELEDDQADRYQPGTSDFGDLENGGDGTVAVKMSAVNDHGNHGHSHEEGAAAHGHSHGGPSQNENSNMKAVLLHVMADALGSVIVVLSALVLWLVPDPVEGTPSEWKLYVDPIMSVIMVTIVLGSAIPLLRSASLIVLQSVPKEISIKKLEKRLGDIHGVNTLHDLHVWKLQSNCIIGSVHIRCDSLADYKEISQKVKDEFHNVNIHCTTIQPEFTEAGSTAGDTEECTLFCGNTNKSCEQKDICCPTKKTTVTTGAVADQTADAPETTTPVV